MRKKKFGRAGLDLKAKRNAMLGFFFLLFLDTNL